MTDIEIRLQDYIDVKSKLKDIKALEATMRLALVEKYFKDNSIGTHYLEVNNYELKCKKSMNTKIDLPDNVFLEPHEWKAIKVKYSVIISEYNNIEDTSKLDEYIIVTPAMPSLEVKA